MLVFDDIHWGEDTFLDLLGYVVEWTSGVPVLILCLARKELLDRRPGWAAGTTSELVVLESLRHAECEALLRGLLGTEEVPDEVTAAVVRTAEGNPLFVEELVGMLIDDRLLVRDDGHWSPTPGLARLSISANVQALLAARLERAAVDAFAERKFGPGGPFNPQTPGAWRESSRVRGAALVHSEEFKACVAHQAQYVFDRFGRFPGTVPSLFILTYLQAHHLDLGFYDEHFGAGAYLPTQAEHMARWHGA